MKKAVKSEGGRKDCEKKISLGRGGTITPSTCAYHRAEKGTKNPPNKPPKKRDKRTPQGRTTTRKTPTQNQTPPKKPPKTPTPPPKNQKKEKKKPSSTTLIFASTILKIQSAKLRKIGSRSGGRRTSMNISSHSRQLNHEQKNARGIRTEKQSWGGKQLRVRKADPPSFAQDNCFN